MLGILQEWGDFCNKRMSEKPADKNLQAVTLSKGCINYGGNQIFTVGPMCHLEHYVFRLL